MVSVNYVVKDESGIHARLAGVLAQKAMKWKSIVYGKVCMVSKL